LKFILLEKLDLNISGLDKSKIKNNQIDLKNFLSQLDDLNTSSTSLSSEIEGEISMEMKAIESIGDEVESDELYSRLIEIKYSLD